MVSNPPASDKYTHRPEGQRRKTNNVCWCPHHCHRLPRHPRLPRYDSIKMMAFIQQSMTFQTADRTHEPGLAKAMLRSQPAR